MITDELNTKVQQKKEEQRLVDSCVGSGICPRCGEYLEELCHEDDDLYTLVGHRRGSGPRHGYYKTIFGWREV